MRTRKIFDVKALSQFGSVSEIREAMAVAIDVFFKMPAVEAGHAEFSPETMKALNVMGIKVTTPSSTPNSSSPNPLVAGAFVEQPLEDFGYVDLFDLVDLRGTTKSSFDILSFANGTTFTQREPGEEAKFYSVSDSKPLSVPVLEFAAGIGILDRWLQHQEFYKIEEVVRVARANAYNTKASLHYALLTALGAGVNRAFATDDATTIDTACAEIIDACKAKGYFVGENVQFYVVCNPSLKRRLTKALYPFSLNPNDATSQPPVFNVRGVVSTHHIASTSYYVVLPGNLLKRGEWMDLTSEVGRDVKKSADDIVWKIQYNAAIGDTQQVKRCALS